MKLKTHLRETPLERLQAIARFWDLAPTEPEVAGDAATLSDYLYPRMQTPATFRAAFEKLDAAAREHVYFLALHGGELPVAEFRARMRLASDETFEQLCLRLGDRGFLFREKVEDPLGDLDLVGVAEPFVRLIELPPYWQGFLGFYLQEMGTDDLRALLRGALDVRAATRKKQAFVHYLRDKLLDPKTLKASLAHRDPLQLEMFQQILQRNGICAWKDLLDAGVHKKFDHARAERLRDLVENSGLVFVFRAAPNKYNNLLMVPRDLAWMIQNGYQGDERTLSELSHSGGPEAGVTPGLGGGPSSRPGVILDNSNNILRDLVTLCAFVQRNPVKMLNNGGLGRNDLKKIVPLLSMHKTLKYAGFLGLFAIARKLIIAVGDQWRVSGALPAWLAKGQGCFRDFYEFWLTTNDWNEEFAEGDVVHADHYPQNLISITELRKLVLRMLEKLPADAWVDFETFAESLLPQVAIEIPGRFDLTTNDKHNRHPILIMESVIAETLYWLGVVVLGVSDLEVSRQLGSRPNEAIAPYDPNHPLSPRQMGDEQFVFSFRLTEFGRHLLARPYLDVEKLFAKNPDPALPLAEQSDTITVQPNQEIVAPPDLALDKFFRLLLFSDIKKMDIMTTMTISPDTIRGGLDAGLGASDMIALLEQCSRKDLPETVRQMIGECAARHGEVDMGLAGGYLKVSDRMRMEELRSNPRIAPSIKDVFGDQLILLSRAADFKKLAKELQRLGYMPRVDSENIYETQDGLFQVTLQSEELYDLIALLRFAVAVEEEAGQPVFEDRVRPLFQRLTATSQDRFNPKFYADSIAKAFLVNFEKHVKKLVDDATNKYRKQLSRLMNKGTRRAAAESPDAKPAEPVTEPVEIARLIKRAIEQESEIRIRYQRSTGEVVGLAIEPEALQAKKVYALSAEDDEHHVYALDRIQSATL
jgi:hypothetical protein